MANENRPENTLDMLREVTDILYDCTKELSAFPQKTPDAYEQIRKNCETLVQLYQEFR